jgi:hypothetical protein
VLLLLLMRPNGRCCRPQRPRLLLKLARGLLLLLLVEL